MGLLPSLQVAYSCRQLNLSIKRLSIDISYNISDVYGGSTRFVPINSRVIYAQAGTAQSWDYSFLRGLPV